MELRCWFDADAGCEAVLGPNPILGLLCLCEMGMHQGVVSLAQSNSWLKQVRSYPMARANHGSCKAEKRKSDGSPVGRWGKMGADLWGEGRQCFLRRSKDALGYQLPLPSVLLVSLLGSPAGMETFPVARAGTAGAWRDVHTGGPRNRPELGAGPQELAPCCCHSPTAHPWLANSSDGNRKDKLLFSCMSQCERHSNAECLRAPVLGTPQGVESLMANGAEQRPPLPPSQCQHKQGLCSAELPAFLKPQGV